MILIKYPIETGDITLVTYGTHLLRGEYYL